MATKPRNSPAVTIYELAEHVGLSTATVSSVLANRHVERRIAEATVRRIREAAAELGYVPNMAGRRLRAHKSATRQFDLAILTSFEAPLPLVSQALQALQRAVDIQTTENTSYAVVIEMFHAGRLSEKAGLLDANRYHGVIITNTLPEDDQFLAKARLLYPAIILGRRSAEILLAARARHPAVLHGRLLTHTTENRVTAFRKVIKESLGREPAVIVSTSVFARSLPTSRPRRRSGSSGTRAATARRMTRSTMCPVATPTTTLIGS